MSKKIIIVSIFTLLTFSSLRAQETYSKTSLEFIFGLSDIEANGQTQNSAIRFSLFFNLGQQWHMDFNNHVGLFTGTNIRNIGFKIKEADTTDIHRAYGIGMPLAIKLGDFKNHFYFYGGGQYELFFHYKHKRKEPGNKTKTLDWFSSRVNSLMPSVFAGIQFPKGLNVRFTYYLKDFLNKNYKGTSVGVPVDYSNWNTQVYYISFSFNFKTSDYKKVIKREGEFVRL